MENKKEFDTADKINKHINETYDSKVEQKLSDASLYSQIRVTRSATKKLTSIRAVLSNYFGMHANINTASNELLQFMVGGGTKAAIRGREFNNIVKTMVNDIVYINNDKYEIKFETKHPTINTDEIPDWYISEKKNNGKVIIGMNQVDLWSGGAQSNRGSKYINDENGKNSSVKILCVVCNKTDVPKPTKGRVLSKKFKLFRTGFSSKTLCYTGELEQIILDWFK